MRFQDLSSRARTEGSDRDVMLWCGDLAWSIISTVAKAKMVDGQIPLSVKVAGQEIDLYITSISNPPARAQAAVESWTIQQSWDDSTFKAYLQDKLDLVASKTGKSRKLAKIELAEKYGLPVAHYYASM